MNQISNIVIIFIVVFAFIFFVTNKKISDWINEATIFNGKYKVKNLILKTLIVFIIVVVSVFSIIIIVNELIVYFRDDSKNEAFVQEIKDKIQAEADFYNELIEEEYDLEKCKNPYILDGFEYVMGTWEDGFVIQDEDENQFVWVPCYNVKNEENIEVLGKSNFSSNAFIKSFDCYEENYEEFLESALENGGFYISRYEIGKDKNGSPVSKQGYKVYNNITVKEAEKIAENMYDDINSNLVNGYAYDVVLNWIINNEKVKINEREIDNMYTGESSYKNIYDLLDNVYEFSSEIFYGEKIHRGILGENKYIENTDLDSRLCSGADYFNENVGFRVMLYK